MIQFPQGIHKGVDVANIRHFTASVWSLMHPKPYLRGKIGIPIQGLTQSDSSYNTLKLPGSGMLPRSDLHHCKVVLQLLVLKLPGQELPGTLVVQLYLA